MATRIHSYFEALMLSEERPRQLAAGIAVFGVVQRVDCGIGRGWGGIGHRGLVVRGGVAPDGPGQGGESSPSGGPDRPGGGGRCA